MGRESRRQRSVLKTPPPNRLSPTHPRQRGTGAPHPDCRGGPLWPPILSARAGPDTGQAQGPAPTRCENRGGPGQAQGPVLCKRRTQARCLRYALRKPGWARASTRACATQEKNAGKMPALRAAKTGVGQGKHKGLCYAREERRQDACATRCENQDGPGQAGCFANALRVPFSPKIETGTNRRP